MKTAETIKNSASLIILAKNKLSTTKFNYNVLLFNRSEKTSFMPNHAVFPGGVAEQADQSPDWLKHFQKFGINDSNLSKFSQVGGIRSPIFHQNNIKALNMDVSLRITSIRETFEEVGILLCRSRDKTKSDSIYGNFIEDFDRKTWQSAVHNDPKKFLQLCEEFDIIPDLWSLYEWSVWTTPAAFTKRFETAFYVVCVNDHPNVIMEENEVTSYTWSSPQEFLASFKNGKVWLPPPQHYELSRLLNIPEIEEFAKFAKERECQGTTLYLPIQYQCTDGRLGVLPGDDLYVENPNEQKEITETNESLEDFLKRSKNLHRFAHKSLNDVTIDMNIKPFNGHLIPAKSANEIHSKSKI